MNFLLSQSPRIISCSLRNVSETLRVGLRCLRMMTFFYGLGYVRCLQMWNRLTGGLSGHTGFLKMVVDTHLLSPGSCFSCHSVRFTFSFPTFLKVNPQILANICSADGKAPFNPGCAWVLCVGNIPSLTHSLTLAPSEFGSQMYRLQHSCHPFHVTPLLSLADICDHFLQNA